MAEDKSTTTLNDGTIVKWRTINPNENNNYQNKLGRGSLRRIPQPNDKRSIFSSSKRDYALEVAVIPDYRWTYAARYRPDGRRHPSGSAQDTAGGKLSGRHLAGHPGLRPTGGIAKTYFLGTDDPARVQEAPPDWDNSTLWPNRRREGLAKSCPAK